MPPPSEKLPFFPKVMPRWFWPFVTAVCISFTSLLVTIAVLMYMRRSSTPMQMALNACSQDARISGKLGSPLAPGFWVLGEHKQMDIGERRDWATKLDGPQGTGILQLSAIKPKQTGQWELQQLMVNFADVKEPLTLVGDAHSKPLNISETQKRRLSLPMGKALEACNQDTRVTAAIGSPIVAGFLVTGEQKLTATEETVNWQTRSFGPKGTATLHFSAVRPVAQTDWTLTTLEMELPGTTERTVLVMPPPAPLAPVTPAPTPKP